METRTLALLHARHKKAGIVLSVKRLACVVRQRHSSLRSFFLIKSLTPGFSYNPEAEVDT